MAQSLLLFGMPDSLTVYIPSVVNKTDKPYKLRVYKTEYSIPAKQERRFLRFPIQFKKIAGIASNASIQISDAHNNYIIRVDYVAQKGKNYVYASLMKNDTVLAKIERSSKEKVDKVDLYITLDGENLNRSTLKLKRKR